MGAITPYLRLLIYFPAGKGYNSRSIFIITKIKDFQSASKKFLIEHACSVIIFDQLRSDQNNTSFFYILFLIYFYILFSSNPVLPKRMYMYIVING